MWVGRRGSDNPGYSRGEGLAPEEVYTFAWNVSSCARLSKTAVQRSDALRGFTKKSQVVQKG